MATVLLFKEHANFQFGKSRLKKGSVFQTNILWISLLLIGAIGLIAVAGNSLRWQWRYDAAGAESSGTVSHCREVAGSKGGYTTYVYYTYYVGEAMYNDEDTMGGRQCDSYQIEAVYPVYYLSNAPHESGIGAFLHETDWTTSYIFGVIGFGVLGFVFYLLMKNRKEQYKHALLQRHAETIIEAEVTRIGRVTGKNGYDYADYVFNTFDRGVVTGQIRSGKGYRWPKQLQRFDKLQILYLDSETYCVL
jgi:hypothetical protein